MTDYTFITVLEVRSPTGLYEGIRTRGFRGNLFTVLFLFCFVLKVLEASLAT